MARDLRNAMAVRDDGLRRISRLTRRIAMAGVALSAVVALAFSHHSAASTAAGQSKAGRGGSGASGPAGEPGTGSRKPKHSSGQLQPPAQNPAPSTGGGQVVSGGS